MAQLQTPPAEVVTATPHSAAAFPKVDLLPPAISEQAKVRRAKLVFGGAALVAVAVVGGLYMMAQDEVSTAQEGLDAATATSVTLNTEVAKYADVPKAFAEVKAANGQLGAAMGGEVRFSYLLNDLALTIPKGVSLTTYTATLTNTGATAAPAGAADPAAGSDVIGTVKYNGEATTYGNVASWLDSQAKQKTQSDVYLQSAARADDKTTENTGITWESSSNLTKKALSHRYDQAGN